MADQDLDQQSEKQDSKAKRSTTTSSKNDTYKNTSGGVLYIAGHRVDAGESYALTDIDKQDAVNMRRLDHAVELGMVEKV